MDFFKDLEDMDKHINMLKNMYINKILEEEENQESSKNKMYDKIREALKMKPKNDLILNKYSVIPYSGYVLLEKFFGETTLDLIINYGEKHENDKFIGVGLGYFRYNFMSILNHYNTPIKNKLYNQLAELYSEDRLFTTRIPDFKMFTNTNTSNDTTDVLIMNVSHLINTINNSNDEIQNLKSLYVLQRNLNILSKQYSDDLDIDRIFDNFNYTFRGPSQPKYKGVYGVNPLIDKYMCTCGFISGNKLLYDYFGENYRCPICNSKLLKIK